MKWHSLVATYKRIKANNNNKTGRGTLDPWPYYDVMDTLLGTRPNITPAFVLESSVKETHNSAPAQSHDSQNKPTTSTKASRGKRLSSSSEEFMRRKLHIEKRRVEQEKKRLALEERRINLLEDLIKHIKDRDAS